MVENKKKISLVVFTTEPIPIGMAATNRIFSYSKGLVEIGNKVIICSSKPGLNSNNNNLTGQFEGVDYKILVNAKSWNINKLLKVILYFKSHLSFIILLLKKKRTDKKIVVLIVSNKIFTIFFIRITTWVLKLPLVQEKSEFPFQYMSSNWFRRVISANIYSFIIYRLFDGMIVMTEVLKDFFEKKTRKSVPILMYPLTLDTKRFVESEPSENFKYRYIGYSGYMGGNKDGISDLIQSFYLVTKKIKDVKLVLVGNAEKYEMDNFEKIVISKGLTQSVVFAGKLDRNEIPSFLKSAEILVLARPKNLQALGGFPTKIGEYLASGRPVVITRVGDIPKYIIDQRHALFCEPGNIEDIALKMESILMNSNSYKSMASQGQQFAIDNFDYLRKSSVLESFLINNYYGK